MNGAHHGSRAAQRPCDEACNIKTAWQRMSQTCRNHKKMSASPQKKVAGNITHRKARALSVTQKFDANATRQRTVASLTLQTGTKPHRPAVQRLGRPIVLPKSSETPPRGPQEPGGVRAIAVHIGLEPWARCLEPEAGRPGAGAGRARGRWPGRVNAKSADSTTR